MKDWIISVVAIVILNSLLFLIIPNGRYSSLLKGIFSIISLYVVLLPVIKLKDLNFEDISVEYEQNLQYDYLEFGFDSKCFELENYCLTVLSEEGFDVSSVNIEYEICDLYDFSIKNVSVEIKKNVIISENEHIVISEKIKSSVCSVLRVYDKEFAVDVYVRE